MRSSYGFKRILQAIYVVFDRTAIVTSHDAGVVSASITRLTCDASLRRPRLGAALTSRVARIFIEKNRLFCIARRWRPSIARFFARLTQRGMVDQRRPRTFEKRIEKIFENFSDAIVRRRVSSR